MKDSLADPANIEKNRNFKRLTDVEIEELKEVGAKLKALAEEEKRLNPPVPQMLTLQELNLIKELGNLNGKFNHLEEHHQSDIQDFTNGIHNLQRQIMSRAARRGYPNVFNEMEKNDENQNPSKIYR